MPGVERGGAWIRAFVEQARAAAPATGEISPRRVAGTRPEEE